MKGKRKRLTNSQSELVATYLPKKIQKDRKIPTSVKLVLANIYQLHYLQKNWGKRTVFCSLDKFIKDIEANDKNEVVRPQAYLMANDMVYINPGVRGRATEYSLNDELYELIPSMFKGELSDNFMKFKEDNQLNIKQLETENQEVIVPSHNSMIDSELQHLNVPSDSETDTDIETYSGNIPSNKDIHDINDNITCTGTEKITNENHNKIEIPDYMMGGIGTKYSYWDNPQLYVTLLTMDSETMVMYSENGVLNKVKEAVSQIDDEELKEDLNKRLGVA